MRGATLVVVVCGFPASGKSTFSDELGRHYAKAGLNVEMIRDGSVHAMHGAISHHLNVEPSTSSRSPAAGPASLSRASLYADSAAEKETRARLKAAMERALVPNAAVIVDSLNYIKGYRYELFCEAKAVSARYVVVHVETERDICVQQDGARDDSYGPDLVRELVCRFEPPDSRNRWDSPLYTVRMHPSSVGSTGENVQAMPCPQSEPGDWKQQAAAIAAASLSRAAPLKKSFATHTSQASGADVLHAMDRATRVAEASLISALHGGAGVGDSLPVPGASRPLVLPRKCKVAELRGMRRAHLNLAQLRPPKHTSEQALVDAYVDYVVTQLRGTG